MGALEQVERPQRWQPGRGPVIGIVVAVALVALAILTRGGSGPSQRLSALGPSTTAGPRSGPITLPGSPLTPGAAGAQGAADASTSLAGVPTAGGAPGAAAPGQAGSATTNGTGAGAPGAGP